MQSLGLVLDELDRRVEQRLVGDEAPRLDPARGRDDQLRGRVLDAAGQLVRGEPAEDHRVDRPDAGAGEHGDRRLRDHRHVDDDAVAAPDALRPQGAGEQRHGVA